ncbi:MAG: MBL fold metallo-hydrolase [Phycisphaerales bacterium]|nr:MBL fold metallo-hydrolase [Phycisphaerae bacterium]NNF42642.1 MBL fold metallo-hydrolase [Phycisphaerales bacterium]NNM26729.1 MBL fold metallo-hydrolase [Phycisphaerales bacterium]
MDIQFLGAARQVTGSRYRLDVAGKRIMVDCGLFQEREHLDRNWEMPITDARSIDVLLLTHAHLDHCGLVPRLVASGFNAPIITTEPSRDLAEIIMLDSARIQQEDAKYKRRRHRKEGRRGRHPALPLYKTGDAERATKMIRGVPYGQPVDLGDGVSVTFHESGHILGSAILEVKSPGPNGQHHLVFSGDLGQWDKPLVGDPKLLRRADAVVLESTYGDRHHRESGNVDEQLERVVNRTIDRGGNVVIPTFAIERAQDLLFHLSTLLHAKRIPKVPVYLDSPMAVDVTDVFRRHRDYMDDETSALLAAGKSPLRFPGLRMSRTVKESRAINADDRPKLILSTSGMCNAGRIKHHLRRNIGRAKSTILFVGYQAHGTLGRIILEGANEVRIHGKWYPVRAERAQIYGFSAHGDQGDLMRWIGHFDPRPRQVFLTHGELSAAQTLARRIGTLGVAVTIPGYREVVTLPAGEANVVR